MQLQEYNNEHSTVSIIATPSSRGADAGLDVRECAMIAIAPPKSTATYMTPRYNLISGGHGVMKTSTGSMTPVITPSYSHVPKSNNNNAVNNRLQSQRLERVPVPPLPYALSHSSGNNRHLNTTPPRRVAIVCPTAPACKKAPSLGPRQQTMPIRTKRRRSSALRSPVGSLSPSSSSSSPSSPPVFVCNNTSTAQLMDMQLQQEMRDMQKSSQQIQHQPQKRGLHRRSVPTLTPIVENGEQQPVKCCLCHKQYQQHNSFYKHLYEHHPFWPTVSSKYQLSKHQQVLLMQTAEVLLSFKKPNVYGRIPAVRF